MNARHKAFCEEYIAKGCSNGTEAYLMVYPKASVETAGANSFKLLNSTEIKKYIQESQKELSEQVGLRKQDLIQDLIEIKNRCIQHVRPFKIKGKIQTDEKGRPVYIFDAKAAVSAIAQASKMLGYEAPIKSEVDINDKTEVKKSIQDIQDAINRAKNPT